MWKKRIQIIFCLLSAAALLGGCAPKYSVEDALAEVSSAYGKLCSVDNMEMECDILLTASQGTVHNRQQILADFTTGIWYSMERPNETFYQEKFYDGEKVYARGPGEDYQENPGQSSAVPQWDHISGLTGLDKSFSGAEKTEESGIIKLELTLSETELENYDIVEGTVCTKGKINYTIDKNGVLTGCTISVSAGSKTSQNDTEAQSTAMATGFQVISYNDDSIPGQLLKKAKL